MTKGEKRIGVDFNPSGNDTVKILKDNAAGMIDLIDGLPDHNDETQRWKSLAMTHIETAAMYAVKAAVVK